MSQDLFADEYAVDDPEAEVEFSGISCSGTSSEPGSQQQKQQQQQPVAEPTPASPPCSPTPPVLPPKGPEGYTCNVCSKVLKTPRGYKGHAAKCKSKPAVTVAPPVASTSSTSSQAEAQVFHCPVCKATLKTKPGFIKHQAAHNLKDALRRMPEPIQFEEEHLQSLMKEIIDEILEEPSYGDETKAVFLKECVKSEKWADFVTNLSESISAIVFEKQTKVLPINQYEEMMRKMNTYLNSNTDRLKEALLCCGSGSSALAGRLVFRIATKLFEGAQKWALKMILNQQADTPLIECQEMSEPEETSFLVEISGFVRSFFSKGLKNPLEHRRSECIKAVFVDGQHPISKTQFLNKCNWYCGEEHNIVLSAHASSFFKIIESEIMPATIDTSSYQEVIENILLHRPLLDHWYYLSCAYFAEDLALLFLRDLVTSYVKFSLHFEERRLNRLEEKSVRASTVALRTHLVKNFVEKDDGSEDVS